MPEEKIEGQEPEEGNDPKPGGDDGGGGKSEADWSRLMQESRNHRIKAKEAQDEIERLKSEFEKDRATLEKLKGVFVVGEDGNPDPTELERRIQEEQNRKVVAESAFVESMAMAELSRSGCPNPKRAVALMAYQGQLKGLKADFDTRSVEGLDEAIEALKESDPDLFAATGTPANPAPSARQVNEEVKTGNMEKAVAALDDEQRRIAISTGKKNGWSDQTCLEMYCYYAAKSTDNPLPMPAVRGETEKV